MTVKLLIEHHLAFLSLKGGCRGSSESTHVKMSRCWKYHALAQMVLPNFVITCWEKADLLDLVCVMFSCCFCTFPYVVPGQIWHLIVSILCHLLYFDKSF